MSRGVVTQEGISGSVDVVRAFLVGLLMNSDECDFVEIELHERTTESSVETTDDFFNSLSFQCADVMYSFSGPSFDADEDNELDDERVFVSIDTGT